MAGILGSNQGMSFEARSDEEEEEGGSGSGSDDSSVFHQEDPNRVLISSPNDITMFTNLPNYKQINTLALSVFMLLLSIGMFITSAIVPFECDKKHLPLNGSYYTNGWGWGHHDGHPVCFMKPVSLLMYMHCGLWAIYLICDQFIRYQHDKIRRRGYIEFYNEVHNASQLPLWIVSAWSTLLLAISTVLHDHCKSATECAKSIHLTRSEYLTICIGLETVALLVVVSNYIYQVVRFNRSKVPPDVFRDDMVTCAQDYTQNSMGRMEEEIFQRQADLIVYFKERNIVLQKAVMELNNRIAAAQQPIPNV